MTKTKHVIIRFGSILVGTLLAVGQTYTQLSSSKSATEFRNELFTGTGWLFFVYLIPYIVLMVMLNRPVTRTRLLIAVGGSLALGAGALFNSIMSAHPVSPIDTPMFDPGLLIVLSQVIITVAILRGGNGRP
jgi:hypothetical protein